MQNPPNPVFLRLLNSASQCPNSGSPPVCQCPSSNCNAQSKQAVSCVFLHFTPLSWLMEVLLAPLNLVETHIQWFHTTHKLNHHHQPLSSVWPVQPPISHLHVYMQSSVGPWNLHSPFGRRVMCRIFLMTRWSSCSESIMTWILMVLGAFHIISPLWMHLDLGFLGRQSWKCMWRNLASKLHACKTIHLRPLHVQLPSWGRYIRM